MYPFVSQGWQIEEVELKLPSLTLATTLWWCNSTWTCLCVRAWGLADDSLVALRCTADLINALHTCVFPTRNLRQQTHSQYTYTHTHRKMLHLNWGWRLTVYHVLLLPNAAVTSCKYKCAICPPRSASLLLLLLLLSLTAEWAAEITKDYLLFKISSEVRSTLGRSWAQREIPRGAKCPPLIDRNPLVATIAVV